MAAFPSQEHRPLKKMRLGSVGPDVYLQDKKQKEVRRRRRGYNGAGETPLPASQFILE